ncbi:hypothetical protein ABENE_09290 [Asticcacaulis benevestitus DSM 16100 = ATCC BAA-896]|uniref:TonB-denpendent receptor n=2 Tax=Asticcacaulis TaxID=76890 RepID=V4PTY5_9CAUL|nr:hypothetical protein ABENE_09290 [Asticcacaulis benevestitus DSM 16100 = ATCC BAA-896]
MWLLSAAAIAAICCAPGYASAQSANAAANDDTMTVVITGIRRSQRQSIDIKKVAINSVDAIASEDLGKMPDQNVAESLQRVPGITIDHNRGVGNGVTVRGLGPQFNTVTVNGRVIATDGAGREFNFDILPSELISSAEVYKSPQANLNGASIGATINIHTLRPLEQKGGFQAGGSARANIDDLGNKTTPSAAAYMTWKSKSGRVGASVVLSYDEKYERTDDFFPGASSYPRSFDDGYYGTASHNNGSLCVGSVSGGKCNPRIANNVTLFRNVDMYHNSINQVEFDHRKRTGLNVTLQYDVSDELRLTFDALASYNDDHYHGSGIGPDFSGGTLVNQIVQGGTDTTEMVAGQPRTVHNGGVAVSESFTNGTVDEIVEDRPATSLTDLFGFNARWKHDAFTLSFDVDTSKAQYRDSKGMFTTVRLKGMDYTYDRRTGSPLMSLSLSNPNYPDASTDVSHRNAHYMSTEGSDLDDTINEVKVDGKWDGDAIALYGGLGYSERTKVTTGYAQPTACAYCGSDVILPSSIFHPTNYNFMGSSGVPTVANWVDYNTNDLIAALKALNVSADPSTHSGDYMDPVKDPAGSSSVQEKVALGYVMTEYKGNLGSMPLAVNTGVRIESTDFTSDGAGQTVISAKPNGTGQNIIVLSDIVPLSFNGHYLDILPSFNARLNLTDDLILRGAASRVISRPTLTDLSSAQSISSNPGNERISKGNPNLQPFRASQAEAGLEWYFDKDSILSATGFYKSIDSFITRGVTTQQVDQVTFIVDQPVNGKGATVKGLELAFRTVFSRLPSPWNGLGTQISYTYTDSDADYSNSAKESVHYSLEGLSKDSFTFVGFYEKGPIQARISYTWRDKYLVAPQTQTGVPEFSASYNQLDAGLQYAINDHVMLTLDGTNLTDSKEFHYANYYYDTQEYRDVGRRYTVGVRFKY